MSETYETINFDTVGSIGRITLNRPEVGNAMSPLMARELSEVAIRCDDDPDVRVVVIVGEGRLFCAGGDLKAFAQAGARAPSLLKTMAGDLHMALSRLARSDAPVIAAVNGTAGGAGMSLVMACDLAIAVDSARFTMAYTNAGLSPDGSSTFYMPRKIGDRRARELMLTNRVLDANEALDWGVVNEVVTADELRNRVMALANQFASGPRLALAQVKALLNDSFDRGLETQMEFEARAIADMIATEDGQEGVSAFLEKRQPTFKGR